MVRGKNKAMILTLLLSQELPANTKREHIEGADFAFSAPF